jgi:hypothetical protein
LLALGGLIAIALIALAVKVVDMKNQYLATEIRFHRDSKESHFNVRP